MLRRFCLLLLLATAARAGPGLGDVRWPPVEGELSGVVRFDVLGPELPVAWRARVRRVGRESLELALDATASGLALHVIATPPRADQPGTWRLADTTIDLAVWRPIGLARAELAALPPDLALAGTLRFRGEGTWREGDVAGEISAEMNGASAGSAKQNWSASGLSVALTAGLAKNVPAVRTLQLGVETVTVANLAAHGVAIDAVGAAGGKLEVRRAEVGILGGRVALTPFTLDPAKPAVDTAADFIGVALGDLAALAPQAVAEASGQIAGRVAVRWSVELGAEPGQGALRVALGAPASLRLSPAPGFLTNHVPSKLNLLPAALGPVARWAAVDNPAYETLRRIELGQLALNVETLEVKLYPDGPDGPLSARVAVAARPAEAHSVVDRVDFTVNVAGPLSQVLHMGLQSGASFRVNKQP